MPSEQRCNRSYVATLSAVRLRWDLRTVPFPRVAEDGGQKTVGSTCCIAVDLVIAAHDVRALSIFDARFKRRHVPEQTEQASLRRVADYGNQLDLVWIAFARLPHIPRSQLGIESLARSRYVLNVVRCEVLREGSTTLH